MWGLVERLCHEEEGAIFGLDVGTSQVFPEDAERDELCRAEEGDQDEEAGPAWLGLGEQVGEGEVDRERDGEQESEDAAGAGDPEGFDAEAGDRVGGEAEHFPERVFRGTCEASGAVVGEGELTKADPGNHSPEKSLLLGHLKESVDRLSTHKPEVAAILGDWDVREEIDDPVEEEGRKKLEAGFPGAGTATTEDDIKALVQFLVHFGEQLGRVLKVRVNDQDAFALAGSESCGEGGLLAEVSGEPQTADSWILFRSFSEDRPGLVRGSIIDEEKLETVGKKLFGDRKKSICGGIQNFLLVEAGDNDGEAGICDHGRRSFGKAPLVDGQSVPGVLRGADSVGVQAAR